MNVKKLPGSPDVILPKYKTAIFVHGCFWHGHKGCKNYTVPKTNTDFWIAKIARNQERDQEVWRQLEALGWAVIIVWECQLKKSALNETVDHVEDGIKKNGKSLQRTKDERKKTIEGYQKERKVQRNRRNL
jgi:DNA mismatch endonuclease (patch repair protein)